MKFLLSLNSFLNFSVILKVGGRRSQSNLSLEQKFPILLLSKTYVVRLLLKREHFRSCHAAAQNISCITRLRFWPLDGIRKIKRIIRNCVAGFRLNVPPQVQLMVDLPKNRIIVARPFEKVSVNFGDSLMVKSFNLRKVPVIKC